MARPRFFRIYYFCAPGCKTEFDKDPEKYINQEGGHGDHAHHDHH